MTTNAKRRIRKSLLMSDAMVFTAVAALIILAGVIGFTLKTVDNTREPQRIQVFNDYNKVYEARGYEGDWYNIFDNVYVQVIETK